VQDNSVLVAGPGGLAIGEGSTIGHNVELVDCTVGAHCLVGIGSRIAAGTVIADDTFVAGGAVTTPAQVLEGGWLWGGVPARKLTPLDDAKRRIVQGTATVYVEYARVLMEGIAAAG
jgi:carbonic anhydrase/acetyltransferase-like protein (isoleucine patch superfamily)